jgi:hypothetical protein
MTQNDAPSNHLRTHSALQWWKRNLEIVEMRLVMNGTRDARFFLVHDTKTGNIVPNKHKMYQMVIKIPNVCKIFQMAIKCTTFSNLRPSKIYPNWYFWFETKPSGNPEWHPNEPNNRSYSTLAATEQSLVTKQCGQMGRKCATWQIVSLPQNYPFKNYIIDILMLIFGKRWLCSTCNKN